MARFETAIFDLDGTIADTLPLIYAAFDAALTPSLGYRLSEAEVRALFGPPDHAIIRSVVPIEAADEAVARYFDVYAREHDRLAAVHEGMDDLLRACHDAGIKVGVVTGKSRQTALLTLRSIGVLDLIGAVFAGDDVAHQKPDPEPVFAALLAVGHRPGARAAFVGDSAADVIAGRAAGLTTIAVTWGSPDHHELHAAQPDIVCDTVSQLAAALGPSWPEGALPGGTC